MKNTTFRKKALLSSIAMLLVALVALGSATFAWFTQNPTVNASGLSLKATAAAGLQILSNSEAAYDTFDVATTIKATAKDTTDPDGVTIKTPVSLDCSLASVKFRTTQADNEKAFDKAALAPIGDAEASYTEVLYLRSSIDDGKGVKVATAKVTLNPATDENADTAMFAAIRVTLVDNTNGSVIGTWSSDGDANKYLTADAVSDADYTNAYPSDGVAPMNKTVGYYESIDNAGTNSVTMYVWLDGEDDTCFTQNVKNLKNIVKSINVQFETGE